MDNFKWNGQFVQKVIGTAWSNVYMDSMDKDKSSGQSVQPDFIRTDRSNVHFGQYGQRQVKWTFRPAWLYKGGAVKCPFWTVRTKSSQVDGMSSLTIRGQAGQMSILDSMDKVKSSGRNVQPDYTWTSRSNVHFGQYGQSQVKWTVCPDWLYKGGPVKCPFWTVRTKSRQVDSPYKKW
jgi:hypothetical protein